MYVSHIRIIGMLQILLIQTSFKKIAMRLYGDNCKIILVTRSDSLTKGRTTLKSFWEIVSKSLRPFSSISSIESKIDDPSLLGINRTAGAKKRRMGRQENENYLVFRQKFGRCKSSSRFRIVFDEFYSLTESLIPIEWLLPVPAATFKTSHKRFSNFVREFQRKRCVVLFRKKQHTKYTWCLQ